MTCLRRWIISARSLMGRVLPAARSDLGGVMPFIMLLMPAMIGMAGLAYDGGNLFAARREAQSVAAAAARDGADDIDVASLYAGSPVLAPSAPATAVTFAGNEGFAASARLISATEVEVSVSRSVNVRLLSIVGVGPQTVSGLATAEMRWGP